jgi:hypothetical protein
MTHYLHYLYLNYGLWKDVIEIYVLFLCIDILPEPIARIRKNKLKLNLKKNILIFTQNK